MVSKVSRPPKVFTLDEANSTLPLVSRILRDIVRCHEEIEALKRERVDSRKAETDLPLAFEVGSIELQSADVPAVEPSIEAASTASAEEEILGGRIRGKLAEIDGYFQELAKIGCECKDTRTGLVDFRAELDERIVFLCWKLGESEIAHWHELEAGFSGRQAVAGSFT